MDQQPTKAQKQPSRSKTNLSSKLTARKLTPWMVSTLIRLTVLVFMVVVYIGLLAIGFFSSFLQNTTLQPSTPLPSASTSSGNTATSKTYVGTVKRGSEIEGASEMCAKGFFIVADKGLYLFDTTEFLLIKTPAIETVVGAAPRLAINENYLNHRVRITGTHDTSAYRCEAMTCECADYILAANITTLDSKEAQE